MNPLKTALLAATLAIAAAYPAIAIDFGSIPLQPGVAVTVSLYGVGGYQWVRVCNNAESMADVAVIIQPRERRVLEPGLCTQQEGYELDLRNMGTGTATITFYPGAD